ncbi:MAG: hypothetical protein GY724_06280 [Actinomycetia bacterium]|nr:hypothetical protein [Actinomycetes bacterium]MCP4221758.1 hypothetical protein [Actinomycetes bacterium]MCP5034023.1 hypothetical protein [Actinomycetes bacterium]
MNRRSTRVQLLTLTAVVMLLATLVAGPSPATAQTGGCSIIDRGGTDCSIIAPGAPPPPGPGESTGPHVTAPPAPYFMWLRIRLPCDAANSTGWTPVSNLAAAIGDFPLAADSGEFEEPGLLRIGELNLPFGIKTNTGFIACVAAGLPDPPYPPPLPTAQEIWGEALTFEPAVNVDPYIRGLTGLETYLWYEGVDTDSVVITLNGYGVAAEIEAIEFRWDVGGESREGESFYSRPFPGSADDPAAVHTYAVPAEVIIVHEVVWEGSATITGPGLPAGGIPLDLGQAVLATARAYDVIEVRTPLVRGLP